MASKASFKNVSKYLSETDKSINSFINEVEKIAGENKDQTLIKLVSQAKEKINTSLPALKKSYQHLEHEFSDTLEKSTLELKKEIEQLKKDKDTVISDNYLLEYKKKDLLLLADNLEEAYEEISAKNDVLQEQKRQISEQADKIKKANEEITAKNDELEQQKEAILDQADYLHEANETITAMHTEVQKQKDEILQKNEELVSLNNEKNNLISIVAHDLKSPLNQIKALIGLIKLTAGELDEETQKYIDTIEHSATRLNEMIGKILDIEAIESQKLNISIERFNISELLLSCVERFKINAEAKEIELTHNITSNLQSELDAGFTNQVFENLISNAIKFSPKFLKIHVSLKQSEQLITICVRDEGPGLSEEDQKKLFGKYQKLSAKPTGNETSTGLGLSIVKKYVEAMSGEIWCESEVNKGARFYVQFKAAD